MKRAIIKIGGSLLYSDELIFNAEVVKKIIHWYRVQEQYESVIFVVGGGKISRFVVEQVKEHIEKDYFRHKVGMKMTHVNAAIVQGMFNEEDCNFFNSFKDLKKGIEKEGVKLAVVGGMAVGGSTDIVAAEIAHNLGVDEVKKISNISNIYTEDPNVNPDAQPLGDISWDIYTKLFEKVFEGGHKPGMNIPIDFKCVEFCKENNIRFRVSGGRNLNEKSMKEVLEMGTVVS